MGSKRVRSRVWLVTAALDGDLVDAGLVGAAESGGSLVNQMSR